METIDSLEALRDLYDAAVPGSLTKVCNQLTPLYRRWIEAARFTVLSTVGPAGTDASPRGDEGPVAHIADGKTLWLPDWRGNNRLDSLENIVLDGRVSLMFMVPGSNNVVRVNGGAVLTAESAITAHFEKNGKRPRTVIVITVGEVYFQCAKALMRSRLWQTEPQPGSVPTAGEFLREKDQAFDAVSYDEGYADYAKERMW
ncbi:MAG: pyridoxamine 5'-phosphate oxidase family protein [Pseudomonadota bacterium]